MSAVGLVTWLTSTSRVRSVTTARIASRASAGSAIGNGIRATTTLAPSRAATARIALIVALYSWSLVSSSSPGAEAQRLQHGVDAGRGVRHERQAVRVGAQEAGDLQPGGVEQTAQLAAQEADGLGLHPVAQRPAAPRARAPGRRRRSRG